MWIRKYKKQIKNNMFCMRKCDRLVLSKKEMKITFAQKNKRKQKGEMI